MKNLAKAFSALKSSGIAPAAYPQEYLRSLEVAIQAALPRSYVLLLEKYGPMVLPGDPLVELYDPAAVCAYTASIWNMDGIPPHRWPAIPFARYETHGDDLGFLRTEEGVGPQVVLLDHEGPWTEQNDFWHTPVAESFADYLAERLQKQE